LDWIETTRRLLMADPPPPLPALEVEVLDGEEEEQGEEADDGEVEAGHQLEVAVLQAQVPLQELAHRLRGPPAPGSAPSGPPAART